MKKLSYFLTLFVFIATLIPAMPVQAQEDNLTEIIQPDGSSGYDTYISDINETTNHGTDETMVIGNTAGGTSWLEEEETSGSITYSIPYSNSSHASRHAGAIKYNGTAGASFSFSAVTTGFHYYGEKSAVYGIVEIFLDGSSVGTYDLYNASTQYQQLIYSVEGLSLGSHSIEVVNTGAKNASSSDYFAAIDYIAYTTTGDTTRGLIQWDFSTLPPDAGVVNATLSLWVAEDHATSASTLQAFVLKRDWDETGVTWVSYDGVPTHYWETKGAWGDTERESSSSGEAALTDSLTAGTRIDIILSPDVVTNMIRENYFGVLLRTQGETSDAYSFYSSDYATDPDMRPMLTIDYDPAPATEDPGWLCVDWVITCAPLLNTEVPVSPFLFYKSGQSVNATYGGPWEGFSPQMGATINCAVYPLCKNDFPIYYRLEYKFVWASSGNQGANTFGTATLKMAGADNPAQAVTECGAGISGQCSGVLQGVIDPATIPTSAQPYDFGVNMQFSFSSGWPTSATADWRIYLSYEPYTENCADTYMVPTVDTYVIEPTIETPQGMVGDETPVDNQGYPTVIDQIYMVRVQQGPWHDGTDYRFDTAVSTDGTTYMSLEEFAGGENALCKEVDALNKDWLTVYFTAPTETFYIRVDDTAGAFANNSNDTFTPLQYVIGLAFLLTQPVDCSDQFTTDETIASIILPSTSEDAPVNTELTPAIIPGDWYGIEVANGSWHETGATDERIDLEFRFDAGGHLGGTGWADLAGGSYLVYCVSTDSSIVFVQATGVDGLTLRLRVNDQDTPQNWADNIGTLGINVYHADFTRAPHDCELGYNLGDFVSHDVVAANATAGKMFAYSLSSEDISVIMTGSLTPGGIYALDTVDGPWFQTYTGGDYNQNQYYYDVKFKTLLGEWSTPAEWDQALCVVDLDGLGHKRVYFQVPDSGAIEYYIKVGGASPFGRGEMGWNLYLAYDNGLTGTDCSSFVYDPDQLNPPGGYVNSSEPNGQVISGLEVDQYFAIEILASAEAADPPDYRKSGWWENTTAEESDGLQITSDGATWTPLPGGVLCYYNKPVSGDLVVFIKVSNGQDWRLRADSESFTDNFGDETYKVFTASGDDLNPWITCSKDYTATVPALNEFEWIPPQDEEGVMLLPTLTYSEEVDTNGDGIIWWENLWLMPEHIYMVETQEGPWTDGEAPTSIYDAQLSSDDGATWYLFGEHPDVICSNEDQIGWYWAAVFTVTEGQKWKIRVADTETDHFTDNGGHLAYKLNLVNEFIDDDGCPSCIPPQGDETFDACILTLVKPEALTLSEIGSLGNYIGDWIQYLSRSTMYYFAWCARHTEAIATAINALKTREPYGSMVEMATVAKNVEADIKSYDWDNGGTEGMGGPQDISIFDFGNEDGVGPYTSAEGVNSIFEQYIMPQSGKAFDVWDGGTDVVDLSHQTGLPSYFYTCGTVYTDFLPSRLKTGACFVSAYWKETGASFWIQLLLDIGSFFVLFKISKTAIQSLVYMMTGVRPWTKDGAIKIIETTAQGGNVIQPVDQWRSRR